MITDREDSWLVEVEHFCPKKMLESINLKMRRRMTEKLRKFENIKDGNFQFKVKLLKGKRARGAQKAYSNKMFIICTEFKN